MSPYVCFICSAPLVSGGICADCERAVLEDMSFADELLGDRDEEEEE
jgi:DNA-directed RNA polymerase subunit RPC12/RpoP